MTGTTPGTWQPDPYRRHELRYFDGVVWTEHVSDAGRTSVDPVAPVPDAVATPLYPPSQPTRGPVYSPPPGYVPAPDERSAAMWCHLGPLLVSFLSCGVLAIVAWIVPLLILNGRGQTSAFVRHHASQSLNFYIEMFAAGFIAGLLLFVLIGFLLLPLLIIWSFIFSIVATVKASSGEWYRIPANLNLVS
jgi:uncharacterized Tic20 family protein